MTRTTCPYPDADRPCPTCASTRAETCAYAPLGGTPMSDHHNDPTAVTPTSPDEQQFWDRAVCAALAGLASQKLYVQHGLFPFDIAGDAVRLAEALLALRRNSQPQDDAPPLPEREGDLLVTRYHPRPKRESSLDEAVIRARADERERCALVCEEMTASWTEVGTTVLWSDYNEACMACANAIRKQADHRTRN